MTTTYTVNIQLDPEVLDSWTEVKEALILLMTKGNGHGVMVLEQEYNRLSTLIAEEVVAAVGKSQDDIPF